jgi:protein transport protein SEC13
VWALSWSHPKYESLLATAGYDRIIKIWKKSSNGWRVIFRHQADASVNCISFAPWEYGLCLAAGIADGKIIVIDYDSNRGIFVEPFRIF